MFASLRVCAGLLAQPSAPPADGRDRDAYKRAEAKVGRDPAALVKLAPWCESRGLEAERLRSLARAVLIDPKNAAARGLMGLVAYGGRWESPEAVSRQVRADEALNARLARYEARRAEVLDEAERLLDRKAIEAAVARYRRDFTSHAHDVELYTSKRREGENRRRNKAARGHLQLALWCEENGLKPEAVAHFGEAAQLAPVLRTPWEHLGCKEHNGRWMTEEQIAAERREAEARRHAARTWEPLLRKYRAWLREKSRREEAEGYLAKVTDPRAVPSIWKVLVRGDAADQRLALRLLGQIDSREATDALTGLAVYGEADDVRAHAAEALSLRDPRGAIAMLVDLLESPLRYRLEPPTTYRDLYLYSGRGTLIVEGRDSILRKSYRAGRGEDAITGTPLWNLREATIQQQMLADIGTIERRNELAERVNARVVAILRRLTGQQEDGDADTWKNWWAEQQGYAYDRPESGSKPIRFDTLALPPAPHTSCFAAGTQVKMLSGLRPIESIRLGDRVLAQDTGTGALSYQPVVGVHRNPPDPTLRLTAGGEAILTTGIHRFWKAGRGWVMARDLKPGDVLRVVAGTAKVEAVGDGAVQPVYNLDVAGDRDFFVGRAGMLVHDFGPVEAVAEPFDAPAARDGSLDRP